MSPLDEGFRARILRLFQESEQGVAPAVRTFCATYYRSAVSKKASLDERSDEEIRAAALEPGLGPYLAFRVENLPNKRLLCATRATDTFYD